MTPADPNPTREADGRADREALDPVLFERLLPIVHDDPRSAEAHLIVIEVLDAITDPANRDAVLRALGLHEERGIDKPGMRGINPQRRFATEWEDVTDE